MVLLRNGSAILVLLLASCASVPRMSDDQKLALYSAHTGAPVQDIRYVNSIGWDKIDDRHLLLKIRPTEEYLLTLSGPCLGASNSPVVEIKSDMGRLRAGFDKVMTVNPQLSCRIEEIRPIDVRALRETQRQMAPG